MKKILLATYLLLLTGLTSLAQYDKDVFSFRGRRALQDGKYATAIENFNVLARLDTNDYWNFFFRGIAKYNLGDLRGAQQDFNASVRLNPVFTNGYHYRAITKSRFGQYDAALEDLQRAIDLRPGFAGLYYSRGVTYFLARRFDDAVVDFNRYLKQEPGDPSAYLNRGATFLYLKDTLKALGDYNKAIKLDRNEPECYLRRGSLLAAKGDYEQALADMDKAILLDSTSTFAYFSRALLRYETKDYNAAMADLDRVLRDEPGNALTLYNRSLILAQVGDFRRALDDMDRVININPRNVLAYFNRASFFIQMERWEDALSDYNKAIELYPDFAKAYMNRSYVEQRLGLNKASKSDYQIAQQKVKEYEKKTAAGASFSDTTAKFGSLIALDADFARKDFDNELLQHRDIDVKLRPLYRFTSVKNAENRNVALSSRYENRLLDKFIDELPVPVVLTSSDSAAVAVSALVSSGSRASELFVRGLDELSKKQYGSALSFFDGAVAAAGEDEKNGYERYYKAFYLMNRAVLRAEMIDFIASIENNVQTLSMDDKKTTRARVADVNKRSYDYSEAIADMEEAVRILPDLPYLHFNLGNLHCLSSQMVPAIADYDNAVRLYPMMGDAYYNRGLVLIYLKDKEKACIDLSRAGELGVADAYGVIAKYCKGDD